MELVSLIILVALSGQLLKPSDAGQVLHSCKLPEEPRNGHVHETRDLGGNNMAYFTCNPGYSLVGLKVLTCTGSDWNGSAPICGAQSCHSHYLAGARVDGLYEIVPDGEHPILVLCDMTTAGGGWTVFQQRLNNYTSFYKDWNNYKTGFTDEKGNLWLGLETLYQLSWNKSELYIEMEGDPGDIVFARYSTFRVGSEVDKYRLTVNGYTGTAGDSLTQHNGMRFSTWDQDNDIHTKNCAIRHKGAWWYAMCIYSNLNGLYLDGPYPRGPSVGMIWYHYQEQNHISMRNTKMMLR